MGRATGARLADDTRDRSAPEFEACETLSLRVRFDRVALAFAVSVEESWVLIGSDQALAQLLAHEQTVLQGPHTEVLASSQLMNLDAVDASQERWPLLAAGGVLTIAPYRSLLVVPVGSHGSGPDTPHPLGTLAMARDTDPSFTEHDALEVGQFAALMAGMLLARWQAVRDVDRLDGLVRDQRHLAAGIVASFLGVPAEQALAILRARAFRDNRTLAEYASDIVTLLGTE